ncbi:MAG: energy transducer TonB [Draconibacterium sp.]|nr:energy transducer TonB [Draconibacterium sp.]
MIYKKSKKADLENKRKTLFLIGFLIALGSVLFAFEWKTGPPQTMDLGNTIFDVEDVIYIPSTPPEKKEPPQQKIEVLIFELVDDNTDIEDEFVGFDSEFTDENVLDIEDFAFASTDDEYDKTDKPFMFVEEMPEFPGGEKALLNYLATNVKYPVIAQENGIQGKVYITFVVDKNGSINNVSVLRGVDKSLDNESIRVISSMPKWKPGKQRGKAVKVQFTVPIVFELK